MDAPGGFIKINDKAASSRISTARPPTLDHTTDQEKKQTAQFIENVLNRLWNSLDRVNQQIFDSSRPIDTYRPQTLAGDSETLLIIQPSYSQDRIENIIITGPVTASPATVGPLFTLQLGGRVWNLALPVTGILTIPCATIPGSGIELNQDDVRTLTSAVAGDWAVELIGHADIRYNRP